MFTRRSLFKLLCAAPVIAKIEAPALPKPWECSDPQCACHKPPPLQMSLRHPVGMGDYIPNTFVVPQNPIPDSEELLGRRAFTGR